MNLQKSEACIEAILFASGQEVSLKDIANCIELDERSTRLLIKSLSDKYHNESRGIQIIEINDSYQMCTNMEYFEYIKKIANVSARKALSQPLLETLAIIAYKQPVTKAEIEEIRGVNADHAVNKLMELNLVCELGRRDVPGKPLEFATSQDFLRYYGFRSLNDLPELDFIMPVE